ncbi:LacI family DNA-binding transcriptional regulator [Alkalicoccobacillus porphyridii]|uniref:LacI family transcriptional regulator n=1 Tax=Alkalicoccobacillus porphyridii TaxID=2597270 RepID=A0A554A413_9BACI|nr:LacI family DNA-binding transcriptional regulator [Alkalicoccobacillus porphyridii]TSB48433.1 LacI family transcriptional regulator [Alkalicoccobacillus porphyridii]
MRKVTIKDVAKEAGVSISTVSKALNHKGYVSKETVDRIQVAVKSLRYQVNANARSLKSERTNKVGVIISDISNPYLMSIAKEIETTIRSIGCHMILMSHNDNVEQERELLQLILEQQVDGLVIIPTGSNRELVQHVQDTGVPIIAVDRRTDGVNTDSIEDDNYFGSYEAINYLSSLGHKKIAVLFGHLNHSNGRARYDGAVDALKNQNLLITRYIRQGNFNEENAFRETQELLLLQEPPTAIYSCNNTMTIGLLKAIQEQGLSIPNDISVIAFGDREQWELIKPKLTLITQPLKRIGTESASLLKNRLTIYEEYEPKKIVIKPRLEIGESCKYLSSK